MKRAIQPSFSFSAYPLKALNLPEAEKKSTYLHILTKPDRKKRYADNPKVFPLINPYRSSVMDKNNTKISRPPQPDSIQERDTDWFASYE